MRAYHTHHPAGRGGAERGVLAVVFALGLAFVGLGLLPWSRSGTPWRPPDPEKEARALSHWDAQTIENGREFRSRAYQIGFLRIGTTGLLLGAALLLGWNRALRRIPGPEGIAAGVAALCALTVLLDLARIPFGLAALANRRAFGLTTQSVAFWAADHAKGLGIALVTTAVGAAVFLVILKRAPRAWPLFASVAALAGGALYTFLLPIVVDPLFNTFRPVPDPVASQRFLDLAARGGVPARTVLVSDASRRTRSVNAYFSGFGSSRRIVLYDTLLESLDPKEAELVVAHEVGHWRCSHIVKGIALGAAGIGIACFLVRGLLGRLFASGAFGLAGPLDAAAAPLFLALLWAAGLLSLPIENAISRRFEDEADRFAVSLTADPASAIRAEESLSRKNLGDVVPPPAIHFLFSTHPEPLDRIARAEEFARGVAAGASEK